MAAQREVHGGILSQTLASSPCIKAILSARIRSPSLNDVVLVGHSSIHLREFTQTGQLTNVITGLELGVQILSAKVISAEAHVLSTEDAILENGRDEVRFEIRGQPCEETQPPQIVVLSIASGELVFVYAKNLPNGSSQFVYARRHVLQAEGIHWPRKCGRHLAIDTKSRAIAVASAKGRFGIMSLKDVDEIKADIDNWDPRNPTTIVPFKESRFIQVDGVILRMDFLRSPTTEPRAVVLLLIVANKGNTRILLYRWNSWLPVTKTEALRCSGQPLHDKDSFPHLLIPSCRSTSFAIVTRQEVVFYDDLSSKRLKRSQVAIPSDPVASDAFQRNDKQWVQWAKPIRHEQHKKLKEDIILVREDGLLKTIVVSHKLESRNSITFEPGHLRINVDTAVCTLSAPPTMGGDILIACGDTTEGGVYHLAAKQAPMLLQTILNWCPLNDLVFVEPKSRSSTSGSVVAATGVQSGRATLTELRYGLEGQIEFTIKHDEATTIDRIWALTKVEQGRLLLLASHHEHTTAISYDVISGELSSIDASTHPQICFKAQTLSAANIPEHGMIQITAESIHASVATESADSSVLKPFDGGIVCTDIHSSGVFVVAGRSGDELQILSGKVVIEHGQQPQITVQPEGQQIDFVPVALALAEIGGIGLCIAGSQEGRLHLYIVHPDDHFEYRKTISIGEIATDVDEPRLSSITVLALHKAEHGLLMCGLKNGQLLLMDLTIKTIDDEETISVEFTQSISVGSTAVTAKVESGSLTEYERSAFISCGSSLMRVLLHHNTHGLDYLLDSIILSDKSSPSYLAPMIQAVDRIGKLSTRQPFNPSGLMVCVAGDELLLVGIGPTAMVPRPICLTNTTKHLIYCAPLKKCIASHQGKVTTSDARDGSQLDRSSLQLYDLNAQSENVGSLSKSNFFFGEKGEKVRALLNWHPTDDKVHYEMIVIGSDIGKDGRLTQLTVKRMSQAKSGTTPKLIANYPNESISAICSHGKSSLVVCAGRNLKLLTLDISGKRWLHPVQFELPSKATELKSKGNVIYVATSLHSFLLLRVEDDQFKLIGSDSYAGKARNIVPHGINSTLINLVSDNGSRILNFADRPTKGTETVFEATVPQAIDRLTQVKFQSVSDERERFLGTTIDGTVYMFTTLTPAEMELLSFLEELTEPIRNRAAKSASLLAHSIARQYRRKLEAADYETPSLKLTHARGDVLRAMLEPGPYNLQRLLQRSVKSEDGMIKEKDELDALKDAALPVLGVTQDTVDGVVLWLRRILNVPSF
ncbi:hypothetical protein LTR64_000459 [Lithohypha guttulata]|uniref:uncharacterized protein n=1 Tax=Lithohypha guttulata TaxID=1690604 RepID=UPI00315DDB35